MADKLDSVQQPLPGLNPGKYAYDALIADNPEPTTLKEAKDFLRKHAIVTLIWKKDHDLARIVLKLTDARENKQKTQWECELPIFNQDEYDAVVIEYAQLAHTAFIDIATQKYKHG